MRLCPPVLLSVLLACAKPAPDIGPGAWLATDTSIVTRALDTTRFHWRRLETRRSPDPEPRWSEPGSGSAFFVVTDSARIGLRHEVMHLLSWRLWGRPSAFWMSEGLASASVPTCGGIATDAIAPMFARAGLLIPLDTLRANFTFSGDTGVVFYLESAALVRFVDRAYGREKLRAMWSSGGLAGARNTLGVDIHELEQRWRTTVGASAAPPWPGWPAWRAKIDELGCS